MNKVTNKRRIGIVLGAMLASLVLFISGAAAVSFVFAGTSTSVQRDITENAPTFVPLAAIWHDVPSTALGGIVVPLGATRAVESTFGAETRCVNTSYCSVRVVAVTAGGGVIEFNPQPGTDFAFDSPGGNWEQHSVHRVTRLGPGTYVIKVQARLVGPAAGALFSLDDYTHFVDVINP
ncbi:MAG TPA: hypothetical protein VFZ58_00920 [Candidatus Saccharimonadales bacterium]